MTVNVNEASGISESTQTVGRLVVARTWGGGNGKWAPCGGDKICFETG